MDNQELIKKANYAKGNSYSPYSNFPVGAALLTKSGKVYLGTNIENASFGATICAERSAIVSAIAQGETKENFLKIAIISNMKDSTYPCCVCRQVMSEFFDSKVEVLMCNNIGEYINVSINELIPYKFTESELKNV